MGDADRLKTVNRFFCVGAVCALLFAFWIQMFLALPKLSATTDEVAHLPAGYTYWVTHDFRLNPEHPPLAKLIAALPLLAIKPHLDLSWPEWKTPQQYTFGYGFLYTNDADRLLFWGRLPMTILATLGGLIVFLWARDMFGTASGMFALGLFAFSPNVLAHAMLVTTDVPVAVFMTLALYLFWRRARVQVPSVAISIGIGLATGAAMASKFSGAILPVILLAFSGWRVFSASDKRRQLLIETRWLVLAGVSALFVIEAAYFFSVPPWKYFSYLRSVNWNRNPDHLSYLFGDFSRTRFWHYFLLAFSVKATIPLLLATALAFVHVCIERFFDAFGEMLLLVTAAAYSGALTLGADDLGVRYLLPVFLLLFVWCSRIAIELNKRAVGILFIIMLVGWQARAALGAFPNYIAYFNEMIGGARAGIYYLDDSNVDWGQGIKQAAEYVRRHNLQNVELLPFSKYESPRYYGINRPQRDDLDTYRMMISTEHHPGTYIVSAHHLTRMMYIRPEWNPRNAVDRIGDSFWVFRF
jgi:Dolichyl-phosphate-mannose-protein mannosyltransferase